MTVNYRDQYAAGWFDPHDANECFINRDLWLHSARRWYEVGEREHVRERIALARIWHWVGMQKMKGR